jgi:hypothetical protein
MPRESGEVVFKGEHIPWHLATEVMDYAHIMKGSEEYMNQQYDEALAAIELLEKEDELMFGEDAEWTGRAKRLIRESKEKIKGIGNPPEPKKPEPKSERAPIQFNENDEGVPDMYLSKHAQHPAMANSSTESNNTVDSAPSEHTTNANYVPKTIAEMRQRHFEKPQPNEYLFYHGLQHYYLSSLDIRILQAAFGSYKHFPSSILPRVERVSSGHVVDDELISRTSALWLRSRLPGMRLDRHCQSRNSQRLRCSDRSPPEASFGKGGKGRKGSSAYREGIGKRDCFSSPQQTTFDP